MRMIHYLKIWYTNFQEPSLNGGNLAPASKVRVLESLKVRIWRIWHYACASTQLTQFEWISAKVMVKYVSNVKSKFSVQTYMVMESGTTDVSKHYQNSTYIPFPSTSLECSFSLSVEVVLCHPYIFLHCLKFQSLRNHHVIRWWWVECSPGSHLLSRFLLQFSSSVAHKWSIYLVTLAEPPSINHSIYFIWSPCYLYMLLHLSSWKLISIF